MTAVLWLLTMQALGGGIKPPKHSVELSVEDVIPTEDTEVNVLLLLHREDHTLVPVQIGQTEAITIAHRLAQQPSERPLTHDLLDRMLLELEARVVQVHVHSLEGGQYHARITLERGIKRKRRIHLDARASDAAAIALGHGVPIYMDADVYQRVALTVDDMIERLSEGQEAARRRNGSAPQQRR